MIRRIEGLGAIGIFLRMKRALASLGLLLVVGACKTAPDYSLALPENANALIPVGPRHPFPDLSRQWEDREELTLALEQSLEWIRRGHAKQFFPKAGITYERAVASLERFAQILRTSFGPVDFQRAMKEDFQLYASAGWNGTGGGVLFTGYCTPILRGSLQPSDRYRHPLYSLPKDLVKASDGSVVGWQTRFGMQEEYPSRAAIEASGMLRGTELVWLADPIDAYLAHVNGSAFVELEDGTLARFGYAGKNGNAYSSLAGELIRDRKIEEASLKAIRRWAAEASEVEVTEYLNRNRSYVFFTPIDGTPHGSLDVPVTSGRSIATDKSLFPRASLVYVEGPIGERAFNRLYFDQDTGGAIRTAGRADLYLGIGRDAERDAGELKEAGQMYYLFLKE